MLKAEEIDRKKIDETIMLKGRPELHLHFAATLIWPAIPYAFTRFKRNEQQHEITQAVATFSTGMTNRKEYELAVEELKKEFLKN